MLKDIFSNKVKDNFSIKELTTIILVLIFSFYILFIVLFFYLNSRIESIWIKLSILLVVSFINIALIRSFLESFIFRRIKVIYKIIREAKLTRKEKESIDLPNETFENINVNVAEWAEKTQEEIEALKSLEEYRKQFVGNISHELKTPIFSIQGYLHTLIDGGIYDNSINKNYLQKALSNADRLQSIVEDLEIVNRFESEKIILDKKKFDIKALTKEIFEDLEKMAQERQVNLQFKEGASDPKIVLADKETIRQVLINLIVNAIKYGKEGGNVRVSFYDIDNQVLVEVSDNGSGIEDQHLKHLFDRFYRVDNGRSRKMGGSGLGLSIVKHIIEAHGQTINVRSTIGLGSTFGFTLDKG